MSRPLCPDDDTPLHASLVDGVITLTCPLCCTDFDEQDLDDA